MADVVNTATAPETKASSPEAPATHPTNRHKISDINEFESFMVGDVPALFVDLRIEKDTVPEGYYMYQIRHDDNGDFATIENQVIVNFAGTLITRTVLNIPDSGLILSDGYGADNGTTWGFVNHFSEFGDSFAYNPATNMWEFVPKKTDAPATSAE